MRSNDLPHSRDYRVSCPRLPRLRGVHERQQHERRGSSVPSVDIRTLLSAASKRERVASCAGGVAAAIRAASVGDIAADAEVQAARGPLPGGASMVCQLTPPDCRIRRTCRIRQCNARSEVVHQLRQAQLASVSETLSGGRARTLGGHSPAAACRISCAWLIGSHDVDVDIGNGRRERDTYTRPRATCCVRPFVGEQ
jgi:hypothetical protein